MVCMVPLICRIRGTVILQLWYKIIFCCLYAGGLVGIHKYAGYNVSIPKDILPVISVVVGLLLVFRTNTAYDRFWEGRKEWALLTVYIRNLARTFWIMVDDHNDSSVIVEKVTVINLLVAFAYATKHYIRSEYSYEEEDLRDLIAFLPRTFFPSSTTPLHEQESQVKQIREGTQGNIPAKKAPPPPPPTTENAKKRRASVPYVASSYDSVPTNIPLEISYYIQSYIKTVKDRNLIDNPTCRILDTALGNMINCLTGFERIRRTPIPMSYSVHLHHATWIVILIVPVTWIKDVGWGTVPAIGVAAFCLLGILEIGREIENPFGYDFNDLNLDDFCQIIHKECVAIVAQKFPDPKEWLFSETNRPIIANAKSAVDLAKMNNDQIMIMLNAEKDYIFSDKHPHEHKVKFNNTLPV
ncbi:hypothetical protein Ocin01_08902 [Orchesella cincta]|uniref:Uncharacterized protein n=1 Tax=Orchesella cincta TaxID=48709 RepID=A0A1D2MXK4_ORCCI|nr:hypothetical protein Ocin01_08902 [Orchesella cincta]